MTQSKEPREVTIRIGDIGISFLFHGIPSRLEFHDIRTNFIVNNRTELKLCVHYGCMPEISYEERIFDSESTWSLFKTEQRYVLQDCSLEPGSVPERLVILEPDFKSGEIFLENAELDQNFLCDPLGHPLNQVLMMLLLSSHKGLILHACGIDDGGDGYLFLGNSTHGKSTISRLWFEKHVTVLNDDRIIVREKDGKVWMYGTPWHGDFKEFSTHGLPVGKIFFLRQGKRNSAVLKDGSEAVSMFLTRCFPPFWDKKGMEYAIDLCHRTVNSIPCYELTFRPDSKIIDFVRNL